MKTILIFTAFYHPFKGGYVESIHELAKGLVGKGHEIKVITCDKSRSFKNERLDGVEVVRILSWNPRKLNESFPIPKPISFLAVVWRLRKDKVDIVLTQTRFFPISWLGFLFAKAKGIPCAHTERGGCHTHSSNYFIALAGKVIDHTFGWLICRFSDGVIGVSEAACDFTKHLGAKNPVKIYNGIDVEFWSSQKHESTKTLKHENTADVKKIVFVGRLIQAKGVQDLLRAFSKLSPSQGDNLELDIVGDGPYRAKLESLAKELEISDCVDFLGEKNREEIRDILWQSDIFVNPSYSEGLPRSVLEAGAVGLPIIATDVGGTREIIPTSDYGLLIEPGNYLLLAEKIKLLLSDNLLREKMGQNINKYIKERFSIDKIIKEYESYLLK